jgi:hypothetical protein
MENETNNAVFGVWFIVFSAVEGLNLLKPTGYVMHQQD